MSKINLQLQSLNYLFRKQKVLDDVSLYLSSPQIVSLLGPNGAGKSTLLKSIAANLYCQSGTIQLNDIDTNKQRLKYLSQIGYMPEVALIISELTVYEQLRLIANTRKNKAGEQSIKRVMDISQLQDVGNKRTNQLSLGFRQRLNLAQALLNEPKLLILDEPLNGLDPHLIIEFRNTLNALKKDTLIIMSTHYLAEADLISDRVLIMQSGKILDNIEKSEYSDLEKFYLQHTEMPESYL
jgi:ABC-2 type transport system ATP-binding protein